ncbi:19052_t:CDS:1, partial [Racocetra persica]
SMASQLLYKLECYVPMTSLDERGSYIWARVNIAIGLSFLPVSRNLSFKPDKTITTTILSTLEKPDKTITTTIL